MRRCWPRRAGWAPRGCTPCAPCLLPLALPGIVAAAALVFAISLGFYITPVLLGGAQTPFIASFIGDYIFTFFDFPVASAAAVILLVAALAVLAAALVLVGRGRLARAVG